MEDDEAPGPIPTQEQLPSVTVPPAPVGVATPQQKAHVSPAPDDADPKSSDGSALPGSLHRFQDKVFVGCYSCHSFIIIVQILGFTEDHL